MHTHRQLTNNALIVSAEQSVKGTQSDIYMYPFSPTLPSLEFYSQWIEFERSCGRDFSGGEAILEEPPGAAPGQSKNSRLWSLETEPQPPLPEGWNLHEKEFCNHKPNKLQAPRTEKLDRVGKTHHSQVTYPATWSSWSLSDSQITSWPPIQENAPGCYHFHQDLSIQKDCIMRVGSITLTLDGGSKGSIEKGWGLPPSQSGLS